MRDDIGIPPRGPVAPDPNTEVCVVHYLPGPPPDMGCWPRIEEDDTAASRGIWNGLAITALGVVLAGVLGALVL